VREAQKVKRLRFAFAAPLSFPGRKSPEFDQARLLRVQFYLSYARDDGLEGTLT
jgi:hypothetical protein